MNTETNLADLHDIITATIQAQFPTMETVEFYREREQKLTVPACLLDLTEVEPEPDEDPGTGQLAARCRFEAELVLPFRTVKGKLAVRVQAAAFAAWLHKLSRWPGVVQAGNIEVTAVHKSDFSPELDQYEVWRVEWQQVLHFGQSIWTDDGTAPTTVMLGYSPEIGAAHEDKYWQVHP